MQKTNASWLAVREIFSAIAWRGVILTAVPPFVLGMLLGPFGVLESAHPFLFFFFYTLWIVYLYCCWLAVLKIVLEKYKLTPGGNSQERDETSSEKVAAKPASHRWLGLNSYQLNGWQRLWVLSSILWIVGVGFRAYGQFPRPYAAPVAGCEFPGELFSVDSNRIVRDELVKWRRELPADLVLTDEKQPASPPSQFIDESPYTIPGWSGDRLGRPKWARTPYVKAYCKTLFERLERSGRAAILREQSRDSIIARRVEWFSLFFAAWIAPVLGVYLFGVAIVWVARGFRNRP